jgi:hypothetical protein
MTLLATAALATLVAAGPAAPAAGPATPGTAEAPPAGSESARRGEARTAALDELTSAVVSYPFTLERFRACAAAVKDLRAATRGRTDLVRKVRSLGSGEIRSLNASANLLESTPEVKEILARHRLSGRDLVLMPTVIQSSRLALFAEQSGRPVPADRSNAAAIAVLKAKGPEVEKLYQAYAADLAALRKVR